MKKIIIAIICAALIFQFNVSARTATEYQNEDLTTPIDDYVMTSAEIEGQPEIKAVSSVMIEKNTGEVLFENNSHEHRAPASITKVMSLLLVMEAIDKGSISLDTTVTCTEHAASMGGSQIWLEPNETMSVDGLLKAAVVASANDAMTALAEQVSGSEETFVAQMNAKAKSLGLKDTNFINCTGLDAENHYSSAYDIAVMSAELLKHKLITNYSTVWMDSLRDGTTELVNTNKLVKYYEGATGLKTGTTSQAGCCLSASAERNGMELITVILGAESGKLRFSEARKLLDYGFANWSIVNVSAKDKKISSVKVEGGVKKYIKPNLDTKVSVLVKKIDLFDVKTDIVLENEIKAPVSRNQTVGVMRVTLYGKELKTVKLGAEKSVDKLSYSLSLIRMIKSTLVL